MRIIGVRMRRIEDKGLEERERTVQEPMAPPEIQCPLCGKTFRAGDALECSACGLARRCGLVMCPNCHYEFAR